jgi:hypothetical protein
MIEKYYLKNMYNMEISIGSYKVRLEIAIIIIVLFWVMFGHLLCSCCRVSFREGLDMMAGKPTTTTKPPTMPATPVAPSSAAKPAADKKKEGFVGYNNLAYGPEFAGAKTPDYIMNPSTWAMPTLTYSPGTTPDAGVQSIWNRPKQPVPLPEGELDMFATTPFKPECCPSAFSSSTGCACMTTQQYNWLRERGGNNVPYSEY